MLHYSLVKRKKKKFLLYLYGFNEVEEMRIFKPGHWIKVRDLTIQNDNELCLLIGVPVKKKENIVNDEIGGFCIR